MAKGCALSTGYLPRGGLPRNSVDRITDRPDMTSAVDSGRKASTQASTQTHPGKDQTCYLAIKSPMLSFRKWTDCTINVAKTKTLLSCAVTSQRYIAAFRIYAKSRFPHLDQVIRLTYFLTFYFKVCRNN